MFVAYQFSIDSPTKAMETVQSSHAMRFLPFNAKFGYFWMSFESSSGLCQGNPCAHAQSSIGRRQSDQIHLGGQARRKDSTEFLGMGMLPVCWYIFHKYSSYVKMSMHAYPMQKSINGVHTVHVQYTVCIYIYIMPVVYQYALLYLYVCTNPYVYVYMHKCKYINMHTPVFWR